jgi:hypothetical protein
MYGFGIEDAQGEPQVQGGPDPKGFREWMDKVSGTLEELRAENDRLRADAAKQTVREALTKQGYAPEAANLYTGKPEGLSDWLSANGAALAKAAPAAEGEQQQAQQGPPATTVSPESQAGMEAFAAAGSGAAPALAGEDALAARLAAASPEEFAQIMREQGNVRF